MAIPPQKIESVMKVLSAWNPLGERAAAVSHLDNYRTEAIDILFHLDLRASERTAPNIVQEVISQAFEIEVPLINCQTPAAEIWRIHSQPEQSEQ
jgi:Domain of unknown function (DUF1871)